MDDQQLAYYRNHYAQMRNDELAHLFVTRRHALSEEATTALRELLAANGSIGEFIREANQTVDDLNAQAAAARLEVERQRDTNRQIPRAIAIVSIAAALIMTVSWLIGTLA